MKRQYNLAQHYLYLFRCTASKQYAIESYCAYAEYKNAGGKEVISGLEELYQERQKKAQQLKLDV